MPLVKNIRLGLLHVAVAITFVLINGILNRVMIHDLQILASVVASFSRKEKRFNRQLRCYSYSWCKLVD